VQVSFVLRQISRSADGREIVRTRTVDQPELTIGRSPDCDIHLPDLAITLHHAVIRQIGAGRIEIAATANLPFDVDGRSTERTEVDTARGAAVRMGSHSLAISAGEAPGAVAITVERVEALSDASETKDENRIFSLAGVAPGKRASAWTFALLVLLAALAWPVWSFYSNRYRVPTPTSRAIARRATSRRSNRCGTNPASPATQRSTIMPTRGA
jgi:hypothetical protein